MEAETTRALARQFFAEQDRLRGGPVAELCAPGYVANLPGAPPLDCAGHQTFIATLYAAFPDLRHEVELLVADGDRVALRFYLHGTHTADFLGIMPTGRTIAVAATAILRVTGTQVVELWAEFDRLGLLGQLNGTSVVAEAAQGPGI